MDGIEKGLDGVAGGSTVLVGIPPTDGMGADPSRGIGENDTLLMYAEIHDVSIPLERAEGEAVEPADGLPTVELAEDGAPTITVPDTEPPTELVAQTLIKGSGPAIKDGQALAVHYAGAIWDSGEVFGSTWESGTPATLTYPDDVIDGWAEGLAGQTVGSQVLLVIPPDKAYPEGTPDGAIKAGDTIVFVVDILSAR
jgi:peptidylprolyl isomerase